MNEEMEKAMNALSGNGAAGGDAGGNATDDRGVQYANGHLQTSE